MTPSGIVREAVRNLVSGSTRAITFALALAVTSVLLLSADVLTVRGIAADAAAFRAAGGSISTVSAPGRIDGRRCELLGRLPGVTSAGAIALTVGSTLTAATLPDAPIPAGAVTPDFPLVVAARPAPTGGVLLSGEAADLLGLAAGDTFATTEGRTTVGGVFDYPRDGRRNGFGYLVLIPADQDQVFDECWVDVWPVDDEITSLLLTAITPGTDDEPPAVGQLNTTMGRGFDGATAYATRTTRSAGLVAGLAAAAFGFTALRTRRLPLASALHSRVRRRDLTLICALETAAWVLPAPVLCLAAAVLALGAPPDGAVAAVIGARVAVPVVIGAALGSALALALTRERHLFAYAKDR